MKRIFITGIPTGGKSYLAKKLAEKTEGIAVSIDDMREDFERDPRYRKWVRFYLDQDEQAYYKGTSYAEQWKNLVAQCEGIWPAVLEKIKSYDREPRPVIFEGVNILPHLAARDLSFSGVVLIGKSFEEVLSRNKKDPRWGSTDKLQYMEAEGFFYAERPCYKAEAEQYGYPVFEIADEAFKTVLALLESGRK